MLNAMEQYVFVSQDSFGTDLYVVTIPLKYHNINIKKLWENSGTSDYRFKFKYRKLAEQPR